MSKWLNRFTGWTATAAKYLVLAAIAVIVGFLIVRFLDVLFATSLYSWFFQPLVDWGVPDKLSGAVAVWLAAIVILALPTLLADFLWRRRRAVLKVASAISVWFVVAYFISLPRAGQLFNPVTGNPMFMYSQAADGTISLLPMGYRYNPMTGLRLKPLDSRAAEEYWEQERKAAAAAKTPAPPKTTPTPPKTEPPPEQAAKPEPAPEKQAVQPPPPKPVAQAPAKLPPPPPPPPPKPAYPTYKPEPKPVISKGGSLYMWAEEVELLPSKTIVKLGCEGFHDGVEGVLWPAKGAEQPPGYQGRAYLTGNDGRVSELLNDSIKYSWTKIDWNSWEKALTSETREGWFFTWTKIVRPHETYRFTLEFGPLDSNTGLIQVFHPQFGTIEIPLK